MATVDVDPLVTATFTPTLPVTTDGSTLTQADLTNIVVSLANRIEFLRSLSLEAAVKPEAFTTFREDFLDLIYKKTDATLYGTLPWTTLEEGAGAIAGALGISHSAGSSKNPGGLRVSTPGSLGDAGFSFFIGPGATSTPFSFTGVQHFSITMKIVTDSSTLLTPSVRCGLASNASFNNGGSNSLGILYAPAFGTDWQLLKLVAGVQTVTPLVPMVIGEYVVFRFEKNAAGDFEIFVNDVLTTSVLAAALPVGGCTFGAHQLISTVEGATSVLTEFDMLTFRASIADRSGA